MSLFALLQAGCLAVLVALLMAAGWQDLRSLRIGNRFTLGVLAAFSLWALAGLAGGGLSLASLAASVLCGIAIFGVGALAFAAGVLGGGDVKLLAAASLFAGPSLLLDFLTVTALAGGVLAVAVLAGAPIGPGLPPGLPTADGTLRARLRGGLPYGPAIAAGGLWIAAARLIS